MESNDNGVSARQISESRRNGTMEKFFGRAGLTVELRIYRTMRRLCRDYGGGYWNLWSLSNGGFFMDPNFKAPMLIFVEGNGFEGELSSESAGIVATLFTLSELAFELHEKYPLESATISERFHQLREYVIAGHPDAALIHAAID
ncbi:MAG: antirestriction protein [Sinobacteraceae bacterium]|nr:antirestriction protein [Nevskiaceae bacterium]